MACVPPTPHPPTLFWGWWGGGGVLFFCFWSSSPYVDWMEISALQASNQSVTADGASLKSLETEAGMH